MTSTATEPSVGARVLAEANLLGAPAPAFRAGQGSPLLLLHGIGGVWTHWAPVIPLLTDSHDVFAPTLPGHYGAWDLPVAQPPTAGAVADALERLLDREQIERPHIVGNSLGGWLALELARRGRARSVTGFSPGGAWGAGWHIAMAIAAARAGRATAGALGDRLRWMISRPGGRRRLLWLVMQHGERISPALAAQILRAISRAPILIPLMQTVLEHDFAPLETTLDCPARIAWGEFDRLLPYRRFGLPFEERVPGVQRITLPGVGHIPMGDAPVLVAKTILETTSCAAAPLNCNRAVDH